MKATNTKYNLLFLFFVVLWAPLIQDNLHLFKGGELKGAYRLPNDISFNYKDWLSGVYAERKTEYLNFWFGFRPDFVRMHNELKYRIFHTSANEKLIIGKENYVYEQQYIDAYFGKSFVGFAEVKARTSKLKALQDTLCDHNIFLFIVYAPGKGSFYPEFFPGDKIQTKQPHTTYNEYIQASEKTGLNFIDMQSWFLAMKDTSRFKLFPKGGIHWSTYGEYLAFDSMTKYIEKNTAFDLPNLHIDSLQLSMRPFKRDYDAGDGLNLITEFFDDTLAYPYCSFDVFPKPEKSIFTVGDSYYFTMFGDLTPYVFKQSDFWYYYSEFHTQTYTPTPRKEDIKDFLLQHHIVCLFYNDATLTGFGSGLIEEALTKFQEK